MKKMKSMQSDKVALQLWMKIVLLVVLFFIVLILYSLVLANIVNQTALNERTLPKVPFSSTKYFCSLSQDVHDVEYKENGMLIVSKPKNYVIGDKILIQNRNADRKVYSINNQYVLGVITEVKEHEYVASLYSYEKEPLVIQVSQIEGKVDQYIASIGALYNNIVGIKGYILFGVIPLLTFCLLYFIFRLVCIDKKAASKGEDESRSEQIVLSDYVEQETGVEWVHPSKEKINEEEEQEMKPIMLQTEVEVPVEQTEKDMPISELEEIQSNDIDKVNEPEKEEAIEETQPDEKRFLSADEIIAMYRESNKKAVDSSNDQFERIAKMYYDNDIENYE